MKKRVEKSKAKPVAAKSAAVNVARKELPSTALPNPHDPLHSLLRGTHAHRVCAPRTP